MRVNVCEEETRRKVIQIKFISEYKSLFNEFTRKCCVFTCLKIRWSALLEIVTYRLMWSIFSSLATSFSLSVAQRALEKSGKSSISFTWIFCSKNGNLRSLAYMLPSREQFRLLDGDKKSFKAHAPQSRKAGRKSV